MKDRFNIDKNVEKLAQLDYAELVDLLTEEIFWLDNIKNKNTSFYKENEYEIQKLKYFLDEYLFFLSSGKKPAAMKDEDFQKTKPITEALVKKGQLKQSALAFYK